MKCVRLAGLALLFAAVPVYLVSPTFAESLAAVSNTAMAVTGDIEFDDFEIVFEDGEKLVFDQLVGDSFMVGDQRVGASVYSVKTPADPVLSDGNLLCGSGDVTFVASWGAPSDDSLTIVAVFTTPEMPRSDADMCASYTYETK